VGFIYGLFDFFQDVRASRDVNATKTMKKQEMEITKGAYRRASNTTTTASGTNYHYPDVKEGLVNMAMALAPPIYIAEINPEIFTKALDASGLFGITVLYGLFPPAIASERGRIFGKYEKSKTKFRSTSTTVSQYNEFLAGGSFSLVAIVVAIAVVIYEKVLF
jgi:hypothetical protein